MIYTHFGWGQALRGVHAPTVVNRRLGMPRQTKALPLACFVRLPGGTHKTEHARVNVATMHDGRLQFRADADAAPLPMEPGTIGADCMLLYDLTATEHTVRGVNVEKTVAWAVNGHLGFVTNRKGEPILSELHATLCCMPAALRKHARDATIDMVAQQACKSASAAGASDKLYAGNAVVAKVPPLLRRGPIRPLWSRPTTRDAGTTKLGGYRCEDPGHAAGTSLVCGHQAENLGELILRRNGARGKRKKSQCQKMYIPRCDKCTEGIMRPVTNGRSISTKTPAGTCSGYNATAIAAHLRAEPDTADFAGAFAARGHTRAVMAALCVCRWAGVVPPVTFPTVAFAQFGKIAGDIPLLNGMLGTSPMSAMAGLCAADIAVAALTAVQAARAVLRIPVGSVISLACGTGGGELPFPEDARRVGSAEPPVAFQPFRNVCVVPGPKKYGAAAGLPCSDALTDAVGVFAESPKMCQRAQGAYGNTHRKQCYWQAFQVRLMACLLFGTAEVAITLTSIPTPPPLEFPPTRIETRPDGTRVLVVVCAGGEHETWNSLNQSIRLAYARAAVDRIRIEITACLRDAYVGVPVAAPQHFVDAYLTKLGGTPGTTLRTGCMVVALLGWYDELTRGRDQAPGSKRPAEPATPVPVFTVAVHESCHPQTEPVGLRGADGTAWADTLNGLLSVLNRKLSARIHDLFRGAPVTQAETMPPPDRLVQCVLTLKESGMLTDRFWKRFETLSHAIVRSPVATAAMPIHARKPVLAKRARNASFEFGAYASEASTASRTSTPPSQRSLFSPASLFADNGGPAAAAPAPEVVHSETTVFAPYADLDAM